MKLAFGDQIPDGGSTCTSETHAGPTLPLGGSTLEPFWRAGNLDSLQEQGVSVTPSSPPSGMCSF